MTQLAFSVGNIQVTAPGSVPQGGLVLGLTPTVQTGFVLAITMAIILSLFSLVWAGVRWIMSEGKKENIDSARQQIVYTIIGLGIVFLSSFIVNMVGGFFHVNLLGN